MRNRITVKAVYVELTSACNLRCLHCYNSSGESITYLPHNAVKKIVDEALILGMNSISLSGGEPLLYPDLIETMQYISQQSNVEQTVITNATLLDCKFLNELKDKGLNPIFQLSFDGLREHHDYIRGVGSFAKLQSSISLLNEYAFRIIFHSLIYRNNSKQIQDMIEFAAQSDAKVLDLTFLKAKGRGKKNQTKIMLNCEERIDIMQRAAYFKHYGRERNVKVNIPSVFYGICPIFSDKHNVDMFIRIDSAGNVYPCQNFGGDCSSLGNVIFDSLDDIVREELITKLRLNLDIGRYEKCEKCFIQGICGRGCPGIEVTDYKHSVFSDECEQRREYARALLKAALTHN